MVDGTMQRLWTDARAAADDADGQASLVRAARLLAVKLANAGAVDIADDWVSVDPHHDFVEQRWREMGMLPIFEWVAVWSPEPVSPSSETIELCIIRRGSPIANGYYPFPVPFEKVKAAEGLTFHVIGVVVPFSASADYWQLGPLVFEALDMRVGIGAVAEVWRAMTPTGLDEGTRYFDLARKPDAATIRRAERALTMRPKHPGGRRRGWRKGQVWSAQQNVVWWLAWELDREPELSDYAAAIGLRDESTAGQRWRDSGLDWPPTTAQMNEFSD